MATFKLLKTISNQFYWTIESDKNYKIIARSSESYINKTDALYSIEWLRNNAKLASFIDETKK